MPLRGPETEPADAALTGRVPLLLVGEEGAGKHYWPASGRGYLCDRPDPVRGSCGPCPSCRTLRAGAHLDLIEIKPPDDKASIPVADIRTRVSAGLSIFPQISRKRVYLIDARKADTLNEQGQNALLKPLEDHPDFIRFILLTEDPDHLLPTIRSRSAMIRLGRRSREAIRSILEEEGRDVADLAMNEADGLPGQALVLAVDDAFRILRDGAFQVFEQLPDASRTYCLTGGLAFFKEERGRMTTLLRVIESLLRDLLLLQTQAGRGSLVNVDLAPRLEAMAARTPGADPGQAAALVRQTARALAANANFDHTVARMLLGLRACLAGLETEGLFRLREGSL